MASEKDDARAARAARLFHPVDVLAILKHTGVHFSGHGADVAQLATREVGRVTDLVVGADVGGTSTRVGVATVSGEVLSLASGGPGNPNTVGLAASAAQIRSVLERALEGVPGRVLATVIGLAGGTRAAADPEFLPAAVTPRVPVPPVLVSDLAVAFSSATPSPQGYVVVSGTGAVAGQVAGQELVQQRGGWGWLLGDEGSGFWIGRAAVRATLSALQQDRALSPFDRDVLAGTGSTGYRELLAACYSAPPTWLAQFSQLVSRHAGSDPVAAAIAGAAAHQLLELLAGLQPEPGHPIVLAGSVLTTDSAVSRAFRDQLSGVLHPAGATVRAPPARVLTASSGVVGALWLALQPWLGDPVPIHARLVAETAQARL